MPSLLRWLHVRVSEGLYGPFPTAEGDSARVPLEWEELAVSRARGPRRRLLFPRVAQSLRTFQLWFLIPPAQLRNLQRHLLSRHTVEEVSIFADSARDIEAGFATLEPATLLLVGTSAAGLGLAPVAEEAPLTRTRACPVSLPSRQRRVRARHFPRSSPRGIAYEELAPGDKVRMTFRVVLSRPQAEALAAQAIERREACDDHT